MAQTIPQNPAEMRFGKIDDIKARVAAAIDASRRYLFSLQDLEEGYWCGELGADSTLVSDYILLHRVLGTEDPVRTQKCARRSSTRKKLRQLITFFAHFNLRLLFRPFTNSSSMFCSSGIFLNGFFA